MILTVIAYTTISSLSVFGGFKLIKKCKSNNEDIIDINNLNIEDVERIQHIIDVSFNNLKKNTSIYDIIEEDIDEITPVEIKKSTSTNYSFFPYLSYIYSDSE